MPAATVTAFFRSRVQAFRYAFAGWRHVLRTQRNAWIHATASVLVFLVGAWLDLGVRDWAVIIAAVAFVWMAEFLNTALEAVVDLASPQQHELARVGKDVGAAAVMIAAISSALIGFLILGPPLVDKLRSILGIG